MYWDHRVMRRNEHGEDSLYIVECFYDDKENSILGWTEKEEVWGEDLDGLRQCLKWMMESLDKPILDEVELLRQAQEHTGDESSIEHRTSGESR